MQDSVMGSECFSALQVLSSLGYHVVTFDYRGTWAASANLAASSLAVLIASLFSPHGYLENFQKFLIPYVQLGGLWLLSILMHRACWFGS